MTSTQQSARVRLDALYQANLAFLAQQFPKMFEWVTEGNLKDGFSVDPQGEVQLDEQFFKGSLTAYNQRCQRMYESQDNPCYRVYFAVNPSYLDNLDNLKGHSDNPDFFTYIEPALRKKTVEEFHRLCPSPEDRYPTPSFGERKLPLALYFGSPSGWLLERVLDDWEIRNLVVVFDDVQKFHTSLFFTDYIGLSQRFAQSGDSFTLVLHPETDHIAKRMHDLVWGSWPPYVMQCAGLFFTDTDFRRTETIWREFAENSWKLFRGWGFLDDEMLGLKHGVQNALAGYPVFSQRPELPDDAVAIVVGNGPSLDTLAPTLRKMADRAVIISCGSAITALSRMGIKPDIHVEIERTQMTYRLLAEPVSKAWVADVPIVALNIMPPDVFTLTNKPLMILKTVDTGAFASDFFRRLPRFSTSPTCTNGGLAYALNTGFKSVYLMGVDLGFADPNYHHSQASVYHCQVENPDEDLQYIIQETHAQNKSGRPVPGNFRDGILSTELFIQARDVMETAVRQHPGARVFNLCDGARIEGTVSIRDDEVDITALSNNKDKVLPLLWGAFSVDAADSDVRENLRMLQEQLRAVRRDIFTIIDRPFANKMEVADVLFAIHYYIYDDQHLDAQISPSLRGGLLHLGRFFYDALSLIRQDAIAVEYGKYYFKVVLELIDQTDAALSQLVSLASSHPRYLQKV